MNVTPLLSHDSHRQLPFETKWNPNHFFCGILVL